MKQRRQSQKRGGAKLRSREQGASAARTPASAKDAASRKPPRNAKDGMRHRRRWKRRRPPQSPTFLVLRPTAGENEQRREPEPQADGGQNRPAFAKPSAGIRASTILGKMLKDDCPSKRKIRSAPTPCGSRSARPGPCKCGRRARRRYRASQKPEPERRQAQLPRQNGEPRIAVKRQPTVLGHALAAPEVHSVSRA